MDFALPATPIQPRSWVSKAGAQSREQCLHATPCLPPSPVQPIVQHYASSDSADIPYFLHHGRASLVRENATWVERRLASSLTCPSRFEQLCAPRLRIKARHPSLYGIHLNVVEVSASQGSSSSSNANTAGPTRRLVPPHIEPCAICELTACPGLGGRGGFYWAAHRKQCPASSNGLPEMEPLCGPQTPGFGQRSLSCVVFCNCTFSLALRYALDRRCIARYID